MGEIVDLYIIFGCLTFNMKHGVWDTYSLKSRQVQVSPVPSLLLVGHISPTFFRVKYLVDIHVLGLFNLEYKNIGLLGEDLDSSPHAYSRVLRGKRWKAGQKTSMVFKFVFLLRFPQWRLASTLLSGSSIASRSTVTRAGTRSNTVSVIKANKT